MKKFLCLCVAAVCGILSGAEVERVSLTVGSTKNIENPFVIESYRKVPRDQKCVSVEVTDSQIQLIGHSIGEVHLIVQGGGLQKDYAVTVRSNLSVVLKKLRNDLASLTELDILINEDKIVLRGTVTDPDHWSFLQNILPAYSQHVQNLAVFSLSADTLADLKKSLVSAGFAFAEAGRPARVGELTLRHTRNTVIISGEMYSKESIAQINQILDRFPYFKSGYVEKVVYLSLVPTILEVDVAFLSLGGNDNFSRTGNLNPTMGFDASFLKRWLDGETRDRTIGISANMQTTIGMMQDNFISKLMDQGRVTFSNDAPNGAQYKFGGTVEVPVTGINNGDLKEISYGYDIKVSGGLVSEKLARLQMNLKSSNIETDAKGNYDLKENSATLTLPLELNKTYIIAHRKNAVSSRGESRFPILGRIPILKWFFSDEAEMKQEVDVLVLVSVSARTRTGEMVVPLDSDAVLKKLKEKPGTSFNEPLKEQIKSDTKQIFR